MTTLKLLQKTGNMSIVSDAALASSDKNSVPVFSVSKLLEKCLSLTIFGDKNIVNSALLLVDMVGVHTVKDKLNKLLFLGSQTGFTGDIALSSHKTMPSKHDSSIKKATEKFEYLKLKKNSDQGDYNAWSVAKSWTPCPIGMIPCSFSSTAVLPSLYSGTITAVLDVKETTKGNVVPLNNENNKRNKTQCADEPVEHGMSLKKPRQSLNSREVELLEVKHPMKGMLLIDGTWKNVSEEELSLLQSGIRTFERSDAVQ
ncbi:hypothetical protein FCM35_KLT19859 [Carex littledalei]|uniref:Uncharacterized protein n=1 Tax=Carex littledalei TaxID=544730 RepID=A0A833VDL3_9POAL|nr:hypothetical protein FCM35_KLT19859 [Carex littledalei]